MYIYFTEDIIETAHVVPTSYKVNVPQQKHICIWYDNVEEQKHILISYDDVNKEFYLMTPLLIENDHGKY